MAATLPSFEKFNVFSDEQSAGVRWRRWVARFKNLLCALDITKYARKKALLLHFCGDEVYNIVESFSEEKKGAGATRQVEGRAVPNEYVTLRDSLTEYFTPKKNTAYEVLRFRKSTQLEGESIDTFHTRLRALASTCEFHNNDQEILTQILQGCHSQRLRRRAVRDNFDLDHLLAEARALELSETRAVEIEGSVNALSINKQRRYSQSRGSHHFRSSQSHSQSHKDGHKDFKRTHNTASSSKTCFYCGGQFPHKAGCPAKGKTCKLCAKVGHFARVCKSQKVRHVVVEDTTVSREVGCETSSDESVFAVKHKTAIHKTPVVHATICDTQIPFIVDTGATVNVLSWSVFSKLRPQATLHNPCPLIYAFGSKTPLPMKGFFMTDITFRQKTVNAKIYITDTEGTGNLLSAETAQALKIIQFAFSTSSPKIIADDFPSLFSDGVGKIKDVKVKLHIDQNIQPVAQQHGRIPFHVRKDVEAELERLERLDIIEQVQGPTPWISPVVVVPKKTGGVRVCIDMREANKAISREKHPMPTMDDLVADLNGSTVFSKLDMRNAYHQLELEENSRYITTFTTHVGLRRYKRLLFGVNAASEIFQNTIAGLLQGIPGTRNLSDDIIIHGRSQQDHDESLRITLQRLEENGARLNKEKCVFSVNELTFFGHKFGEKGVSADPEKVKTITNTSAPENVSEVRSFLGMTQYMSRFIPGYASITEPLRKLTRKETVWKWTKEEQQAFDKLKHSLTNTPVMSYFSQTEDTTVLVDASPIGLGAILMQKNKVICYASRALTDTEQRYSQTDREMLALVYGVEHFHLYLHGSSFTVVTDHKPLLGIMQSRKPTTARIERWRLRLMPYNMTLIYRPGRDDLNPADYISRHPYPQTPPTRENAGEEYIRYVTRNAIPKAMTVQEVRDATQQDDTLENLMCAVQSGRWDCNLTEYARFKDELSVHDGVILRGHRLIIPASLQRKVVEIAHQSHQGIVKTKKLIREKVWFPGIDKMVEEIVKTCIPCQASYPGPSVREPVISTPLPSEPWVSIAIDFAGPFPTGDYVMVVTDEYSRYPEAEIITSTSAEVVIAKLDEIFARQGFPQTVKSDNGAPFQGLVFSNYTSMCGFKHRKVTPLWPETNGQAERFIETLNANIRASEADNLNWKKQLQIFLRLYRGTPHSATQVSPFEALRGRKMNIGLPNLAPVNPTPLHARLSHNVNVSKQKMASYANIHRHTSPSQLQPGDRVLVKQRKKNTLTTPFHPRPYTIIQKKGSMITAQRGDQHLITRNSSHFKQVQPGPLPEDEDEEEEEEDAPPSVAPPYTPSSGPPQYLPSPGRRLSTTQPAAATPSPVRATPSTAEMSGIASRPARQRQAPTHLKDYDLT
ncbi:hypothetical protein V1264_003723 [Littorina saxatilis]|uniref:Reverse transcriptase n=1 Tax=Littorina saxatilis TaxID=31220 RepID=A0AAN9B5M7_9CAEN